MQESAGRASHNRLPGPQHLHSRVCFTGRRWAFQAEIRAPLPDRRRVSVRRGLASQHSGRADGSQPVQASPSGPGRLHRVSAGAGACPQCGPAPAGRQAGWRRRRRAAAGRPGDSRRRDLPPRLLGAAPPDPGAWGVGAPVQAAVLGPGRRLGVEALRKLAGSAAAPVPPPPQARRSPCPACSTRTRPRCSTPSCRKSVSVAPQC